MGTFHVVVTFLFCSKSVFFASLNQPLCIQLLKKGVVSEEPWLVISTLPWHVFFGTSTRYSNKVLQHGSSTRYFNKVLQQGTPTRYFNKLLQQGTSTRYFDKILRLQLEAIFNKAPQQARPRLQPYRAPCAVLASHIIVHRKRYAMALAREGRAVYARYSWNAPQRSPRRLERCGLLNCT